MSAKIKYQRPLSPNLAENLEIKYKVRNFRKLWDLERKNLFTRLWDSRAKVYLCYACETIEEYTVAFF